MEAKKTKLPDETVEYIRDLISSRTGIKFNEDKTKNLKTLILKRIEELNFKFEPETYRLLLVNKDSKEYKELLNVVTNHETYFFRNKTHFLSLKNFIIPQILKRKTANEDIVIWCAGSATGEEPYSIAMYLKEFFPDSNISRFKIYATDIAVDSVEKSKQGIYANRSFRDSSFQFFIDKYFNLSEEFYSIKSEIKTMVSFAQSNLLEIEPPVNSSQKIDLILCRNVFIYFDHDSIRKVTDGFFKYLHDDGFLVVGHSEAINQITDKFQPIILGDTFVFQKSIAKKPTKKILKQFEVKPISPEIIKAQKEREAKRRKEIESQKAMEEIQVGRGLEESLFNQALEDFNYEKFREALEKVEGLLRINPNNEYGIILKANILANERKYDWSERLCKQVLNRNPINAEAYFLLGIISNEKEDFTSAIKYFKQVLFLNNNCGVAYFELAFSFQQIRLYSEALANYSNAIKVLKKNHEPCFKTFKSMFVDSQLIEFCNFNIKQIKKIFRR